VVTAAARWILPAFAALALAGHAAAAPTLEARELAKIGFAPRSGGVLRPALSPNDPQFAFTSYRWVFENPRFLDVWTQTLGDARTIIAVVDTGVDPATADLQGALLPGYDFYDNDTDPSDAHGHGTMMASLAAARTNNGLGIAGACGACSILPVRVSGPDGQASWSTTAAGIVWAADHGARVISVSLVGPSTSPELGAAVAYAQAHNALVVAAAGNLGQDHAEYPAALPGVLSVEAVNDHDAVYPFSNHGSGVALAAPGCAQTIAPTDVYKVSCGTSVATPLVAGAAGLLASVYPAATAQQLYDALTRSAARGGDSMYGRLDVAGALALLAPGAVAPASHRAPATRKPKSRFSRSRGYAAWKGSRDATVKAGRVP
jgi:subtilisin family serine protease